MTNRNDWKLGLSQYHDLNEEFLERCAKGDVECVEFSYTQGDKDYDKVAQWSKNTGVEIWSRHLDFIHLSVAHPDADRIVRTLEKFKRFIDEAAVVGVKAVVVHPSSEPIADHERGIRMNEAIESFSTLVEYAKPYGITVCCESLPRTCLCHNSDEALQIVEAVDGLKLCFDTNHLLSEDPVHFIQQVGKHIFTTHVSDYDFINERHWMPLQGKVDWKSLISELERCDYKGPFLYETGAPGGDCSLIKKNRDALYAL